MHTLSAAAQRWTADGRSSDRPLLRAARRRRQHGRLARGRRLNATSCKSHTRSCFFNLRASTFVYFCFLFLCKRDLLAAFFFSDRFQYFASFSI